MSSPEGFDVGPIGAEDFNILADGAHMQQGGWDTPVPPHVAERIYALGAQDGTRLPMQGGDPTLPETSERPVNAWGNPAGYVDSQGRVLTQEDLDRLGGGWGA